ncbi:MAG: hypothetical protein EOO89_31060 [Pedobacter sp.]|nr:MAG: hypothetical protein EOO89_31060 [Pedobacter sp.]
MPGNEYCEYCIQLGEQWESLLTCQACGITLCCDFSTNRHMSNHAHNCGHAVAITAAPVENWGWYYIDKPDVKLVELITDNAP